MSATNAITIVGNLTDNPTLSYTKSEIAVANFSVAHTPRRFVEGEWTDGDTVFIRCTVWREYAEHVAASLSKGDNVLVIGELVTDNYEREDGTTAYGFNLSVTEIGPALRFVTTTSERAVAKETAKPKRPTRR